MDRQERLALLAVTLLVYGAMFVRALALGLPGGAWRGWMVLGGPVVAALCAVVSVLRARPGSGKTKRLIWSGQAMGQLVAVLGEPRLLGAAAAPAVWLGAQSLWLWRSWRGHLLALVWGIAVAAGMRARTMGIDRPLPPAFALAVYLLILVLLELLLRNWRIRAKDSVRLENARAAMALLAQANLSMKDYAIKERGFAVASERARLAREVNDTLSRALTSIVAKLHQLDESLCLRPEAAFARIEEIRETAREGMSRIRTAIEALRAPAEERPRGKQLWESAANAFAETTGIRIVFCIQEEFDWIPEDLNELVYRAIQEGLANAIRHGNADLVEISIRHEAGCLLLRLSDNGHGSTEIHEGRGLRGLRDLVAARGGEMEYRNYPGYGFDLGLDLPLFPVSPVRSDSSTA